jgi:AcrR family transcriptional regulator
MNRMSGEQRRPQIAAAALKVIAEKGLSGFTTRSISQEVGLAEGTIFRHFENKEDIVRAAIDLLEDMLEEDLSVAREGDPVQRLGRFVRRRVQLITENPGVMRILFSDELARAGAAEDVVRIQRLKQRARSFIRECIQDAAAAGSLRLGLSSGLLPLIVQGAVMAVLFGANKDDSGSPPVSAESLWQTLEELIFSQ